VKITLREIVKAGTCKEAVASFRARFGESATDAEAYNWLKEHPDWLVWATGHPRWCKILLAHGADVKAKNNNGWTPLRYAAESGSGEVVKLLLAKGADVNAKDCYGATPLHVTAWNSRGEVAKLLLANGADVNAKNSYGTTPLHWGSSAEIVKILEAAIAKAKGA